MEVSTPELIVNTWEFECMHTPETIDKIVMNFRKRGLMLNKLNYEKIDEFKAICTIEFEETPAASNRIFANVQRIYDVIDVKRL